MIGVLAAKLGARVLGAQLFAEQLQKPQHGRLAHALPALRFVPKILGELRARVV
jgi:hypothetical protein